MQLLDMIALQDFEKSLLVTSKIDPRNFKSMYQIWAILQDNRNDVLIRWSANTEWTIKCELGYVTSTYALSRILQPPKPSAKRHNRIFVGTPVHH